jgi:DUF1680 family protein
VRENPLERFLLLVLSRGFEDEGDVLTLNLPLPVRRVLAHERVADDAGRVALERGPLVYCFEGVDHNGKVTQLSLPDDATFEPQFRSDLLGGVTVLRGPGQAARRRADGSVAIEPSTLTAIPYYAWCNRGAGQMQVWIPRRPEQALPY